jgi:hypothetical protein
VAGFDGNLANDFLKAACRPSRTSTSPTGASGGHDISKYLRGARLRERIQFLLS